VLFTPWEKRHEIICVSEQAQHLVQALPAEELFWRGWLMRWIISKDWAGLEIGTFTTGSFLWVTLLFTMAHPEWLAAAVWCVLINLLLYWKKDLWNCIVAHGVSNLCLAAYIMLYDAWYLW
jgi:CAAX prenyl protease-like protein